MDNTTKIILGSLSLGLFVGSSRKSTNKHYFFIEKYASRMRPWLVTKRPDTIEIQVNNINSSPDCLLFIEDEAIIKMVEDPRSTMMYNGIDTSIEIRLGDNRKTISVDCSLVQTEEAEALVNMLLSVKHKENKLKKWSREEFSTGISENPKFILEVIDG